MSPKLNLHRANHVGSFLRPPAIHKARAQFKAGEIDYVALRKVEDVAIRELVEDLRRAGVKTISDGEFRREYFHLDFLRNVGGVTVVENNLPSEDKTHTSPPTLSVTGKLQWEKPIQLEDFKFLQSLAKEDEVVKVAIPSPTMVHFRGGRASISIESYPSLDEFFTDLAQVWREEIASLVAAGCKFIQLDDTNLAYLLDPAMRKAAASRGEDLNTLPLQYAELINSSLQGVPEDVTIGIHLCRGNFRSKHFAEGGYEGIAEVLFQKLNVDVYFLEFDDDRSGNFEPLRFIKDQGKKVVVVGIISSKVPQLEDEERMLQRMRDAEKWAGSKERLGISPQCGFASTVHGNEITVQDQWNKMQLVNKISKSFFGDNQVA
ncbi:UROD/MetE-like protein [Atractiella rhizophila]|nr:UROD/MetE-like protein [Atractiella rhizophila]